MRQDRDCRYDPLKLSMMSNGCEAHQFHFQLLRSFVESFLRKSYNSRYLTMRDFSIVSINALDRVSITISLAIGDLDLGLSTSRSLTTQSIVQKENSLKQIVAFKLLDDLTASSAN